MHFIWLTIYNDRNSTAATDGHRQFVTMLRFHLDQKWPKHISELYFKLKPTNKCPEKVDKSECTQKTPFNGPASTIQYLKQQGELHN